MSLNVEVKRVTGQRGPERGLELWCQFLWHDGEAFLLSVEGRLSWASRVLSERVRAVKFSWQDNRDPALLRQDAGIHGTLFVPLDAQAIRLVEEERGSADVHLRLELRYRWQEAIPRKGGDRQGYREKKFLGGRVYWTEGPANFQPIPRSEWLKRLKEMEWSETELFEVSALPLCEDENLMEALRLLREAQDAFRVPDDKGVLVKCREALESAAKYEAEGDTKRGYELLLSRAFPEQGGKQSILNTFIKAFSEYAHLGRHAQYPALHISHGEARFALTTTLSLFSLLSQRLAGKETT